MYNGLYVATSGLLMQQNRVDSISNNIANINTNGFKRDRAVFSIYRPEDKRYPQNFIRESHYNKTINTAVLLHENSASFEKGTFKKTDNKFDFALEKENAFFAIDTPWGVRYTRDGAFTLNSDGELVTAEGYKVMSRNAQGTAYIQADQAQRFEVDKNGAVYANGVNNDEFLIVEFDDVRQLQKVGRNQFAAVDVEPIDSDNPGVHQGFVEGANVDPIQEMVRMIDASRGYEMYAKVVQTHDEIAQKSATQILTQ